MKKRQRSKKMYLLILVALVVFLLLALFSVFVKVEVSINSKEKSIDERYEMIEPTVLPSKSGWRTFVYPKSDKQYSFDFPDTWTLKVEKDKHAWENDIFVAVSSTKESNDNYNIIFMQGGRGSPQYDYDKTEITEYGGRIATKHTLYRDGNPFEIFISFNDKKNDPFVGIDIQLPRIVDERQMQVIDKILSSLTFNY